MSVVPKILDINKFNTVTISTIFEYVNKYANINGDCNDCYNKTLCNILSGSKSGVQFNKAMKKLGGNSINVKDYTTIINKLKSPNKHIGINSYCDIIILSDDTLSQTHNNIVTTQHVRMINSNIVNSITDLYTIQQQFDFINCQVKILVIGESSNATIQSIKYLLELYPNIVISYHIDLYNINNENNNYDIIYYVPSCDDVCAIESDMNEIEKIANMNTFIMYRLSENNQILNKSTRSLYPKQLQNDLYVRMSLIYVCLFNLLDNTYDTLEYNYLNQLQSEIHHW